MRSNFEAAIAEVNALPKPLPGFIGMQSKNNIYHYGVWYKNTYVLNKKVYHDSLFLGRVVSKEQGIFYKNGYGLFKFTLENGFGEPPEILGYPPNLIGYKMDPDSSRFRGPLNRTVDFGDIWMLDQVSKQIGLDKVLEGLIPEFADTLKALVAFRLIKNDQPYCFMSNWYRMSFASILYPKAIVDSTLISQIHQILGKETTCKKFFASYLENIKNSDILNKQITFPILIDSTLLPNDKINHLAESIYVSGKVGHEIKLIYVVDRNTKLPIHFKLISGDRVDNSMIISTVDTLNANIIDVKIAIMNAGYYTEKNVEQLVINNIDFITRLSLRTNLFKQLVQKNINKLSTAQNLFMYEGRAMCGIKESVTLFGKELFAYVMRDVDQEVKGQTDAIRKYHYGNKEHADILAEEFTNAGKFIILSSVDYTVKEILPMYYASKFIEQPCDVNRYYVGLLPVPGHFTETISGIVLTSFIASILYSSINYKLSKSKFFAYDALIISGHLRLNIYQNVNMLSEMTQDYKQLFADLNLEIPFKFENEKILESDPVSTNIKSTNKKRGRPKGSVNNIDK
jgi:hypothetical protein